ncbi:hypothetical protein PanWU01x14_297540 [Parasponia andersonii]|uniref:Uncharacterized protein n=1 Tax=Parasponia andersonii TaxID=3476 RepID=A0A2P5AV51_PARAD|nr:hypothetical protein PanWU01x14_297540 [Parasponia andersonii]
MGDLITTAADNSTLGPATFQVASTEKWAISNVSLFSERQSKRYSENNLAQATGNNSPELFQAARMFPGSLRYIGLGL